MKDKRVKSRAKVPKVKKRRAKLASSRSSALVRTLPNEVLSHIFELGALDQEARIESPWEYQSLGGSDFESAVSQVSRHFRDVAVSTPALWTMIHIKRPKESQIDYVKTYLERSGALPWTMTVDYIDHEIDPEASKPAVDQVMALVKANTYRLERFIVNLRQNAILRQMMEYMDQPAPQLTKLELHDFSSSISVDLRTARRFLLFDGQMPKLANLILESVCGLQWSHHRFESFESLTDLDLMYENRPTYEEFRPLIDNSPALRKLSLYGRLPSPLPPSAEANSFIVSDFLEHLEMTYVSLDDATAIVSFIRAPNLKTLVLAQMHYADHSSLFDQIAGPPALFPNLTSLKIVEVKASEAALRTLLQVYPQLESLELQRTDEPQLVDVLESTDPGGPRLCPNLKYLRCVNIEVDVIRDVLKRRLEADIPLPELSLPADLLIEDYSPPDPAVLEWIQENVEVKFEGYTYDMD